MATPLLGFKTPAERTQAEHDAHELAVKTMTVRMALPRITLAKGEKIMLTNFHQDPRVIKRRGFAFSRIHQWTGSCVWAGGTNALTATISAAACSNNPIEAILPFTLPNYADSRHRMGDDSQGDGSMGSTFFASLTLMGCTDWAKPVVQGQVAYHDRGDDGVDVGGSSSEGSKIEYQYSSIRFPTAAEALKFGSTHHVSKVGEQISDTQTILDAVGNGYGCSFACNNFIGHGSIKGQGENAFVTGYWDSRGGHQQYVVGAWMHPDFGLHFLTGNNWPKGTYPITPSQPVCFVWVPEEKVASAIRNLDSEVFPLGRPDGFPAQPELLNYVL
jgi:hypothetical protein